MIEITDVENPCKRQLAENIRCIQIKAKVSFSTEITVIETAEQCVNVGQINFYSIFSTETEGKGYILIDPEPNGWSVNFKGDPAKEKVILVNGYHYGCEKLVNPDDPDPKFQFGEKVILPVSTTAIDSSEFEYVNYDVSKFSAFRGAELERIDYRYGTTFFDGPSLLNNKMVNPGEIYKCQYNGDLSLSQQEFDEILDGGKFDKQMELTCERIPLPLGVQKEKHSIHIEFELLDHQKSNLVVSPAGGLISEGPDCKKVFNPKNKSYTLKNTGKKKLDYSITKKANWIDLSQTEGSLNPREETKLNVEINQEAKNLAEGYYKDELIFTNRTDGNGNTSRKVEVNVGEEQCWQVRLTGYEISDSIPRPEDKRLRVALKFDFDLSGEFVIKKQNGVWNYKRGKITSAAVSVSSYYQPPEAWSIKPIKREKFERVKKKKGDDLPGNITGDKINFFWGYAKIAAYASFDLSSAMFPEPEYDKYRGSGSTAFEPDMFFHYMYRFPIPLKEGEFSNDWKKNGESIVHSTYNLKKK